MINDGPQQIFDLGIIIALNEEFREFLTMIKAKCIPQKYEGHYYYCFEYRATLANRLYNCVATCIGGMGPSKAGLVADRLINKWHPSTVVNVGIAAGIHKDIKVGDVLIADQIDNYLISSKAIEGTNEECFELKPGGEVYKASWDYIQDGNNLEFAYPEAYSQWIAICQSNFIELIPENTTVNLLIKKKVLIKQASLMIGHLASGPVVGASEAFISWIHERDRNYIGLEMESAGVLEATYARIDPTRVLVIRGISDYGDKRKKKLDKIGGGALRRYAMRNAVNFLCALMKIGELFPQNNDTKLSILPSQVTSVINPCSWKAHPPGNLIEVPSQIPHFLPRHGVLEKIKKTVLAQVSQKPVAGIGTGAVITIQGMGGAGKSVFGGSAGKRRRGQAKFS